MKEDAFRNIVAEWLEEGRLPDLVERDREQVDFTKLTDILAIVGPRRAGKTFYIPADSAVGAFRHRPGGYPICGF